MKLLQEYDELKYSGSEIKTRDTAKYFIAKGMDVHVLSIGKDCGEFAVELEKAGCLVHHIPLGNRWKFLKDYYQFLKQEQFDVVHVHLEHMSFWVELVTKIAGVKKIVRSYHSCFPYRGTVKWTNVIKRWIARCLLGVINVAVSDAVCENEQQRFRNPCRLISNGVDVDIFKPISKAEKKQLRTQLGFADDDLILITVGICNDRKRHMDLFQVLEKMIKASEQKIYLLHLGEGPLLNEERRYAQKLGIEEVIKFMDNRTDVDKFMKISDIYLMPSKNEGLSIALLEAMASGLAVIVSDIPAFNRIIKNDHNGILCPVGEISALIRATGELLKHESKRLELGQHARALVENQYNLEQMVNPIIEICLN